jgi:ABC-type bacteriocin/lantibiotic exporter with double-glycine peptidase domain
MKNLQPYLEKYSSINIIIIIEAIKQIYSIFFNNLLSIIFTIGYLFIISNLTPFLLYLILIWVIFHILFLYFFYKKINPIQNNSIESLNNFNNNFLEVICHIHTIKINNSYNYEYKKNNFLLNNYVKYNTSFIANSELYLYLIKIFSEIFLWGGGILIIIYYIKMNFIKNMSDCTFIIMLFLDIRHCIREITKDTTIFIENLSKYHNIYDFLHNQY